MQTRYGPAEERYRYARPADIATITRMLADEEVGRWLWFVPAPETSLDAFFRPFVDGQWESLADAKTPRNAVFIVEDADGAFLGQGAAVAVDGSPRGFEIGYQLPREAWGQGVGTRLAEFLIAWAVHEHDAFRIQAGCLEGNAGSRTILERLGLSLEGTRIDYRLKGEARHTELEYGARVSELGEELLERAKARAAFED